MANNSSRDILSLAESLRQQVAASQNAQSSKSRRNFSDNSARESTEMHGNVLALLDLIEEQTLCAQQSEGTGDVKWPWLQAIDDSFARWQAQVTNAYAEGASRELADHLKFAELLAQTLGEREERLEEQRQRLEKFNAQVLSQEARCQRQRKSVGQGLRARRAELLLELEMRRSDMCREIRDEIGDLVREEARGELREEIRSEVREQLRDEVCDEVRDELRETVSRNVRDEVRSEVCEEVRQELGDEVRSATREEIRQELREEIREEIASQIRQQVSEEVRQELEQEIRTQIREEMTEEISTELRLEYEEQLEKQQSAGDQDAQVQTLELQLEEARTELSLVLPELERLQAGQNETLADDLAAAEEEIRHLREREQSAKRLQAELDEAREMLNALESDQDDARITADRESRERFEEQLRRVEQDLESYKQEAQDLKEQNSDLAAQLARQQVLNTGSTPHVSFDQQSLSWEERKKLIMQQLEDESDGVVANEEVVTKQIEIEKVLEQTQKEIEQRDREIQELHGIIEQQSDTRQGVAIGAAAFAQAFDADEMIQEERLKLKAIQKEWEEKLRQAEIDVSMERAKLARERLQLEAELERQQQDHPPMEVDHSLPKKRKWLEHLGLKDEGRS